MITVIRSLSGPGHVLWSSIAGYYLGLGRAVPEHRGPLVVKGLAIAAFLHGSHNAATLVIDGTLEWWAFQLTWHLVAALFLARLLFRYRSVQQAEAVAAPLRRWQ